MSDYAFTSIVLNEYKLELDDCLEKTIEQTRLALANGTDRDDVTFTLAAEFAKAIHSGEMQLHVPMYYCVEAITRLAERT